VDGKGEKGSCPVKFIININKGGRNSGGKIADLQV
jgi:hypothetical protein